MATDTTQDKNSADTDLDSIVTNTSTTEVGHSGASDEDPTGAIAAGGLVNSDFETPESDEGTPPTPMGAHRSGNITPG